LSLSFKSLLLTTGLVRPARARGFCPACGLGLAGAGAEISSPAVLAVILLGVAAAAWAVTIWQARAMTGMAMGLGTPASFAAGWSAMAAAMMLPTAVPLVVEFARSAEGRSGWRTAAALLVVSYLGVWLGFGVLCYLAYNALRMPWPDQPAVGGAALAVAGLYALTPLKRRSQERCRELCALHERLPFNLVHSAWLVGLRYGLSCLGCTGALMVALLLIGMASLGWAVLVAGVVLVYKLARTPSRRQELLLSLALATSGAVSALAS
jgi:predicted metal-binding membrane protein